MTVTLTSTTKIIELVTPAGTVPARVWEGVTESGIPVHAMITRLAVEKTADAAQFERELLECREPTRLVDASYPTRIVL